MVNNSEQEDPRNFEGGAVVWCSTPWGSLIPIVFDAERWSMICDISILCDSDIEDLVTVIANDLYTEGNL